MANDVQRQLPDIPLGTAGTTSILDIPRDSILKGLDLVLKFTGTQGATAATGLADPGLLGLIRRIEIVADGSLTLWSIDGFSLYVLNALWFGVPFQRDTPGATFATGTYHAHLHIPFALPFSHDPNLTLLNAQALSSLQLKITWGAIGDIYTTPNNTTIDATTLIAVGTHEIVGLGPRSTFSAFKVGQVIRDITAASTAFQVDLPRNAVMRGFLVKARNTTSGVEDVTDTLLNELRVESSELNRGLFVHRRLRGTDTNATARNGYLLRNHARRVYGVSDLFAPQAAGVAAQAQQAFTLTGFYPVEFMEDKEISSALRTQSFSTLQAIMDVAAGGTSPRLEITTLEIVPAAPPGR